MAINGEFSFFTYNLKKLKRSDRVKFVYALKGRKGNSGLVSHYKGNYLAPACFIIPVKNDKHIIDIFKLWKVRFKRYHIKMMDDKG